MSDSVAVRNPYLEAYRVAGGDSLSPWGWDPTSIDAEVRLGSVRSELIPIYGFALPDERALGVIAGLGEPIVEVGAGLGYWASLLAQAGVDVVATDSLGDDFGHWFPDGVTWFAVEREDAADAARRYSNRTLMMVWPYMDDMAERALAAYSGSRVIYVGEEWGGCCATDAFFEDLERSFTRTVEVAIPQWPWVHDFLSVWERS